MLEAYAKVRSDVIERRYDCSLLLSLQLSDMIIPTRETAIQTYFLHVYLTHETPMMFVGPTGTGKSAITNNHLVKLPKERCVWRHSEVYMTLL